MLRLTVNQLISNNIIINSPVDDYSWEQYFPADGYHLQISDPNDNLKYVTIEVIHIVLKKTNNNRFPSVRVELIDNKGDVVFSASRSSLLDIIVSRELFPHEII